MASLRVDRAAGGPRTPAPRARRPSALSLLLLLLGAALQPQECAAQLLTTPAQLLTTPGSLESAGRMVTYTYDESISSCWEDYQRTMDPIKEDWCDWAVISSPYSDLQECLERGAEDFDLGFPNPWAEQVIFKTHQTHFANCTPEQTTFSDPPEDVLLAMIITPICLIPFLVTLVVWKSKDSEART